MVGKTLSRWLDHLVAVGPLRRIFQNPNRILRQYVRPGLTVLDVGCGVGYFSLEMARMVGSAGRVICVDLDAGAIQSLAAKAATRGLSERMDIRVCDERGLGISDFAEKVDFALAFYVVHHAADADRLMADIHAALKPSGRLLVVEPGHHSSAQERELTKSVAGRVGFDPVPGPRLRRDWVILFAKM